MNDQLFRERTFFYRNWLIWAVLILVLTILVFTNANADRSPEEAKAILWTSVVVFGVIASVMFINLQVNIDSEGIRWRLLPFIRWKKAQWDEIKSISLVRYNPLFQYGGWGIRYSFRKGWAYNIAGNKGLEITKKDGKQVLLGTMSEDQCSELIETLRRKFPEIEFSKSLE